MASAKVRDGLVVGTILAGRSNSLRRAARVRLGDPNRRLHEWLATLPARDGIRLVSAPVHFGGAETGEEEYAKQFIRDEALEQRIGHALRRALAPMEKPAGALEVGAGTGILTRPLVQYTDYPSYFITDTSAEFLRLTRGSVALVAAGKRVDYAVLSGDELDRWPRRSLSLVVLRYVLHHVLDWERFMHTVAELLVPGGVLVMEEPCADGFVLQAALVDLLLHSPSVQAETPESVRRDLEFMAGTTYFYANDAADKSQSEDKHVFPAFRLLEACREVGLVPRLYPNQGVENGLKVANRGHGSFAIDFRHNLAVNFGFGDETLAFFDRHLADPATRLATLDAAGGGPIVRAVVVAGKPAARRWRTMWRGR